MPRGFRRSGSFSGRTGAPRRQIFNTAITGEVDGVVPIVGVAKALGSFGVAAGVIPVTLVRTRGRVQARMDALPAAVFITRIVMGIIVVSADAFAIGFTAVPGPISDSENDWVLWEPLMLLGTPSALPEGDSRFDKVTYDSRGMRKLKEGDILAVVFEVESDVAGGSIDIGYSFREQFKV